MPEAWICEYPSFPELKFASTTDQTGVIPSLVCRRLEGTLPGGSLSSFLRWRRIAQLIEDLP